MRAPQRMRANSSCTFRARSLSRGTNVSLKGQSQPSPCYLVLSSEIIGTWRLSAYSNCRANYKLLLEAGRKAGPRSQKIDIADSHGGWQLQQQGASCSNLWSAWS